MRTQKIHLPPDDATIDLRRLASAGFWLFTTVAFPVFAGWLFFTSDVDFGGWDFFIGAIWLLLSQVWAVFVFVFVGAQKRGLSE